MRGRKLPFRRTSLLGAYSADLGQLISRKRAEDALRAAGIESALANRVKSEFLANMSHELRTPLNAIIGFSGLMKEMKPAELANGKGHDYLDHVSNAGKHLLRIINDILDLSKMESGSFTLNIRKHAIKEIVHGSVAIVQPRIFEKKQALGIRVPDDVPFVAVDDLRVKQVLINLLSNASKFTGEGGKIFVVVTADNERMLTCAVSDTGIGMTPEEVTLALKPFAQVQSSYSRDQEGTGLGLPIAKTLVLQHGGQFHISSQPKVGTTVAFTLPIQRDEKLSGKMVA